MSDDKSKANSQPEELSVDQLDDVEGGLGWISLSSLRNGDSYTSTTSFSVQNTGRLARSNTTPTRIRFDSAEDAQAALDSLRKR